MDENERWKFDNFQIVMRMTQAVLWFQFKVTVWPQFLNFPAFCFSSFIPSTHVSYFDLYLFFYLWMILFFFFFSSLSVKSWYITKIYPTQRPYTVPLVLNFTNWYNSKTSVKWLLGNTMLSWENIPKAEWYQCEFRLPASAGPLKGYSQVVCAEFTWSAALQLDCCFYETPFSIILLATLSILSGFSGWPFPSFSEEVNDIT